MRTGGFFLHTASLQKGLQKGFTADQKESGRRFPSYNHADGDKESTMHATPITHYGFTLQANTEGTAWVAPGRRTIKDRAEAEMVARRIGLRHVKGEK